MQSPSSKPWLIAVSLLTIVLQIASQSSAQSPTSNRQTPLVKAIEGCSDSVVNLRGRKTVNADSGDPEESKQVNGMGTGVIIDSRGYVLTNYHVVQGVRRIEVTTSEGQKTTARLLAHDPETDLAILKIELAKELPTIRLGTSSDLMLAETVAAVGNAYGYEHTVTVGIISQLGRTVQVNDDQVYRNLIQTDASINPGNSGGPLLNLNGEMIGINVAVRIGAQGIAFAIPVNDALDVAARLMDELTRQQVSHGLSTRTIYKNDRPQVVVQRVEPNSPAATAGLRTGDVLLEIDRRPAYRELDWQCALINGRNRKPVEVTVSHDGEKRTVRVATKPIDRVSQPAEWKTLGLKLTPASDQEMANRHPMYKRGLRVTKVRSGSPADEEGILPGDILVAMRGWKTESIENLMYILEQPDVAQQKPFMFYILRDQEPFWGKMRIADSRLPVALK